MYKHILIPTDGSELAELAVDAGIRFASQIRARVTGFTAVPEYRMPTESEMISRTGVSLEEHNEKSRRKADQILQGVAAKARAAGVEFGGDYAQNDRPSEAIIAAAKKHGCDLIFMSSHGRRGLSALVHGSQTHDVLTRSTIPTLVYR